MQRPIAIGRKVAGKCQPAPHDHDRAGEIVDLGLTDPANDDVDIRQRGSGLLRIDARHELTILLIMTRCLRGEPTEVI